MGTTPFPVNLKKGNKKSSLNQNSDCFLKTYEIERKFYARDYFLVCPQTVQTYPVTVFSSVPGVVQV